MKTDHVEPIVRAVLYEGFMLYPYRRSSVKNQKRASFGTLAPGESMQTQCLATGPRVSVRVRFLIDDVERSLDDEQDSPEARVTVRIENLGAVHKVTVVITAKIEIAAAHTILAIEEGDFISMLEPPDALADLVATCVNERTWPVLVGEGNKTMLSSPIILYDHPLIAPESPGDLFDGTEIDEILTLRILALSDAEKLEMAAGDPRVRAILARTEALGPDDLMRLHGIVRNDFRPGDHVRLRPRPRSADAFDVILAGKEATVASVEKDYEGRVVLAVTIDCDPGKDLGAEGKPGHRFHYRPEEVERLP